MTSNITKTAVLDALRAVQAPDGTGKNIVDAGYVEGVDIHQTPSGARVQLVIGSPSRDPAAAESLHRAVVHAAETIKGVEQVAAVLTAHHAGPSMAAAPAAPRPSGEDTDQRPAKPSKPVIPGIEQVRHIIAVASGKGGVGKSTTAVNLAVAMGMNGLRAGLLDADLYGPSVPHMLGIHGKPVMNAESKMLPMQGHGIQSMSIGYLLDEQAPVIWRGPMIHGALRQLMGDVAWGDLDVLIVDMPPGTGDAALTLVQSVALSGAVIVSTPQDIALLDARKSLGMFQKADVPILGIIENMSGFTCPHCGHATPIFNHGGAAAEADKLKVPFLGAFPLDLSVREAGDGGVPIVRSAPHSPHAQTYRSIADGLWQRLVPAPK